MAPVILRPFEKATALQTLKFLNACCALDNMEYPDKWSEVCNYCVFPELDAERAKMVWGEWREEYKEARGNLSFAMLKEMLAGDAMIYPHKTCPTCEAENTLDAGVRSLPTFANKVIFAYLDNGGTRECRVYSRTCSGCGTCVFPCHRVLKNRPGSKLPLPKKLANQWFVQYTELSIVSKMVIERYQSYLAVASPVPMENTTNVRSLLNETTRSNRDEFSMDECLKYAAGEYIPTPFSTHTTGRDALNPQRLSQAVYYNEMEQAVQNHGHSLMDTFDWGNMTEYQLYKLTFDIQEQQLIDNFTDHMFSSGFQYFSMDGLCQLVRDHCSFEYPVDRTHPYDKHAVMCPRSLVFLKDR